jgi:hypothetical protein
VILNADAESALSVESHRTPLQPVRVYPFGVARDRLVQSAKRMGVPAIFVKDAGEADVLVTLRSYYRDRQQAVMQAEHRGMPVYVLRANTVSQMEQFLSDLFNLSEFISAAPEMEYVKNQTQAAIAAVLMALSSAILPMNLEALVRIRVLHVVLVRPGLATCLRMRSANVRQPDELSEKPSLQCDSGTRLPQKIRKNLPMANRFEDCWILREKPRVGAFIWRDARPSMPLGRFVRTRLRLKGSE